MSAPVPLRLRPLEIGDILDETFRTYRRHFVLLAGIAVVFSIPLAALTGYGLFDLFNALLTQATSGSAADLSAFWPSLTALAFGSLLNYVVLQPLMFGAVTFAVCESALGHPVSVRAVLGGTLRRYFHLAGYFILIGLMNFTMVCLFPLWIWILVGWAAILPLMFIENLGLGGAMSRSWRLVQGRWWRTFFILFLIFVLNSVVSVALGAFMYLGQLLLSLVLSTYLAMALYYGAAIIVNALITPILVIALVLIYFDLRVRREGLDLFQLAQRVAALPPAPA